PTQYGESRYVPAPAVGREAPTAIGQGTAHDPEAVRSQRPALGPRLHSSSRQEGGAVVACAASAQIERRQTGRRKALRRAFRCTLSADQPAFRRRLRAIASSSA